MPNQRVRVKPKYSLLRLYASEEHISKLKQWGIFNTNILFERIVTGAKRTALSKVTGIAKEDLMGYYNQCDLLRIKWIGPIQIQLLFACGCRTTAALSWLSPKNLTARLGKANNQLNLSQFPPTRAFVERWVKEAKSLHSKVKVNEKPYTENTYAGGSRYGADQ